MLKSQQDERGEDEGMSLSKQHQISQLLDVLAAILGRLMREKPGSGAERESQHEVK